ncbi:NADP-dependent oxidoreductase [Sphingorhabdus sp. SMR4y]|uniref:NADP-dependent oxidoreductase n=1 Tax=Sphingorhabdus sp. SMR4y TaxID=2584094 RepID=UPI000B5CF856|nr:NADP-dependent oxidoreductase [Sphingorhabdus sp. SMR4y]ASK88142.1 NADPH-dependent curcumin reductase [Sphingorhabdus sp. SMR4y]
MTEVMKAWRLRSRPVGEIADGDLELVTEPIPPLDEGQVLVEVNYVSLDPTNRIWMSDMDQYMPPVALGDIMRAGIAGKVLESRHDDFEPGMTVGGLGGCATHFVADGATIQQIPEIPGVPLAKLFGSLGGTGLTAYFGLLDICDPRPGETLVVSAASGAVGSVVGQIGKIKGCRVIGIAGGEKKCRYVVDELGFDACIDYKNEDVGARLDELCPDGIDMNFENVGGDIMEAVMSRMNDFGRMALCGMISTYNDSEEQLGPKSWPLILMRRLKVQGFIISDYANRFAEGGAQLGTWAAEGRIRTREDIRPGIENAIVAMKDLYVGGNFGKLLLEVKAP